MVLETPNCWVKTVLIYLNVLVYSWHLGITKTFLLNKLYCYFNLSGYHSLWQVLRDSRLPLSFIEHKLEEVSESWSKLKSFY